MGLDLLVEASPRPGHEAEWRRLVERSFGGEDLTDGDTHRFAEISIPPYKRLDAPRVGYDQAADDWIIETQETKTPEAMAEVLKTFHGYYAVRLVACDGVPKYSHGGFYEGVDDTSFRGSALRECPLVLPKRVIDEAWEHKFPDAAMAYGQALLAAAEAAAANPPREAVPAKRGLLSRLGLARPPADPLSLEDQLEIVRAAGRWFVFWGERGHPIRAWS